MARRKVSESPFAIYCWFIQVLIVLSLAAIVVWLSTKPKNPQFTITDIRIPQTGIQNSSRIQENNAKNLVFVLEITNPNNGMAICYVEIDVKLHKGGFVVGNKSLEAFCQGRKKSVTEEVVVIGGDQELRGGGVEGDGGGWRVTVETVLKYRVLNWKTKIRHMGFEGFVRIGSERNFSENIYLHKIP